MSMHVLRTIALHLRPLPTRAASTAATATNNLPSVRTSCEVTLRSTSSDNAGDSACVEHFLEHGFLLIGDTAQPRPELQGRRSGRVRIQAAGRVTHPVPNLPVRLCVPCDCS
eukprot:SAG11_NODE_1321_length_5207_cov_66.406617_4_plen_112_part_00